MVKGKDRVNKLPVIGVTVDRCDNHFQRYESTCDYSTAVERAGGLPVMLPYRISEDLIPQYVDLLDGLVFTGGDDLNPHLYGEPYHPNAELLDPKRQQFELALMAEAERRRLPMLGICLGEQLMNVYRGGSLIQFLPDLHRENALEHRSMGDPTRRHLVRIIPGTVLAAVIGKRLITVNTRHKQAVGRVGRGLRVNAIATDGIIEGVEDPALPLFLGVQWHAENLIDVPEHLAVFKLLVEKAGATREEHIDHAENSTITA
jgi:putative glutamine amidotransferase